MRIGVFCSGGDSPGMNACIRAVVRAASFAGHEVVGFRRGYQGLIDADLHVAPDGQCVLNFLAVRGIIQDGGTILYSSRCDPFRTEAGIRQAAANLENLLVDALIPIGGDGTLRGAVELAEYWNGRIVACPGTIDNDLLGSDYTIGFHTAVATAVDAVDKLRDTAESHQRLFLVEVMGRHSGYIALYTALAAGAEVVCLPETPTDVDAIVHRIGQLQQRGRSSIMVIVAEGDEAGGVEPLRARLEEAECPFAMRSVKLGHIQRGGSPVVADRMLASRLGELAVRAILEGQTGVMAGEINGQGVLTPFEATYAAHKPVPLELVELVDRLAG